MEMQSVSLIQGSISRGLGTRREPAEFLASLTEWHAPGSSKNDELQQLSASQLQRW